MHQSAAPIDVPQDADVFVQITFCINRVLRRVFGPKRDEVTEEWSKLHNVELNDLYCSPNNIRVIKLRRILWAGHVARMVDKRGA